MSAVSCGQKSRRANPIIRFEKRKIGIGFFFLRPVYIKRGEASGRDTKIRRERPAAKTGANVIDPSKLVAIVELVNGLCVDAPCALFSFFFLVARPFFFDVVMVLRVRA
jgi:hypothetical protein